MEVNENIQLHTHRMIHTYNIYIYTYGPKCMYIYIYMFVLKNIYIYIYI